MLRNHLIYNDYFFSTSKSSGSFLWDEKGGKFIDFTSGWNVTNLGWNEPEVNRVAAEQLKKNAYASMWTPDPIQEEYAAALTAVLPGNLKAVGRATGGTEANEEAIKVARAFTGRAKIIGFRNSYHGQSLATLSLGYPPDAPVVKAVSPLVPAFIQIDFPRTSGSEKGDELLLSHFAQSLEKLLREEDIAAIVTEAGIITGWGSAFVAPEGYLALVRRLTKKYGTLMILDEVGTGFSRCGKLFGLELEGVVPDIITFAKGISNGAMPMGAMVTSREIAESVWEKTVLISTFGWTPPACAAALKTLEIHRKDRVWQKAEKDGNYLQDTLKRKLRNNAAVVEIRGKGMLLGLEFVDRGGRVSLAKRVVFAARKRGLNLIHGSENNIQIMPPLTIERIVLDRGIDILLSVVEGMAKK